MNQEAPRQAIAAFKINCIGAEPAQALNSVEASITVNNDGTREVGCPYMGETGERRGKCLNIATSNDINCTHLYPQT